MFIFINTHHIAKYFHTGILITGKVVVIGLIAKFLSKICKWKLLKLFWLAERSKGIWFLIIVMRLIDIEFNVHTTWVIQLFNHLTLITSRSQTSYTQYIFNIQSWINFVLNTSWVVDLTMYSIRIGDWVIYLFRWLIISASFLQFTKSWSSFCCKHFKCFQE